MRHWGNPPAAYPQTIFFLFFSISFFSFFIELLLLLLSCGWCSGVCAAHQSLCTIVEARNVYTPLTCSFLNSLLLLPSFLPSFLPCRFLFQSFLFACESSQRPTPQCTLHPVLLQYTTSAHVRSLYLHSTTVDRITIIMGPLSANRLGKYVHTQTNTQYDE